MSKVSAVSLSGGIAATRTEAIFVVLTFIGMMTGLSAGWTGLPGWVVWTGWGMAYVFGAWFAVIEGANDLVKGRFEIDLLMVLAALGALVIGAPFEGAMLLFLFSLSNVLQNIAIGRSRRAIEALMELRPDEALVRRGEEWVTARLDEVSVGEIFSVRPGDRLPLDGEVVKEAARLAKPAANGDLKAAPAPVAVAQPLLADRHVKVLIGFCAALTLGLCASLYFSWQQQQRLANVEYMLEVLVTR